MNGQEENNQADRSMQTDENEHGKGSNGVLENTLALVSSKSNNEEPHSQQDRTFLLHVHPSTPFYAESVDGYSPPEVVHNQYSRSVIRSKAEIEYLYEVITDLNDMINRYGRMNVIVRKGVMDRKMRLSSLLKFSAMIQFEIISLRLMNFVGYNGELHLLPSLVAFIKNRKLVLWSC